eukprot:5791548-Pyramimonas_sp.AAC.1
MRGGSEPGLSVWHFGAECEKLARRCQPIHGNCSRAGCPRIELVGREPVGDCLWTFITRPYPASFCRALASILIVAVDHARASVLRDRFYVRFGQLASALLRAWAGGRGHPHRAWPH